MEIMVFPISSYLCQRNLSFLIVVATAIKRCHFLVFESRTLIKLCVEPPLFCWISSHNKLDNGPANFLFRCYCSILYFLLKAAFS